MTLHGWCNEFSGDVECPTGFFARMSNTAREVAEIAEAFEEDFKELGLVDINELVGHFLLMEDSDGFVSVVKYEDEELLKYDYRRLDDVYCYWSEGQS
jgi:hypothetical protein